jgi:hypothetical protein
VVACISFRRGVWRYAPTQTLHHMVQGKTAFTG